MKICFVTTFFTGATLPLVKHLQDRGHHCDLYLLANQGMDNIETLDFDVPVAGKEIRILSKENSIYAYLNKNVNVSIVPYFSVKNRKYLIGYIPFFKNLYIIHGMLKEIGNNCYDLIYVIVNEEHDAIIARDLYKKGYKNVVIAYHEVLKSHTGKPELKDVVEVTIGLNYPVICYSEHTTHILIEQIPKLNLRITPEMHTIYFGPFETYRRYNVSDPIIKEPYILFIGSIQPYKGLSFLYESIRDYGQNLNTKIVIAGSGYDSCLAEMQNDSRYVIINHFLSDEEFANLSRHAICIVCPYISGSQSGITHAAMVFGTPVVATKVGAFPEFIIDKKNGTLIDYGDNIQLVDSIMYYVRTKEKNKYIPEWLNWDKIVESLEEITVNDVNFK